MCVCLACLFNLQAPAPALDPKARLRANVKLECDRYLDSATTPCAKFSPTKNPKEALVWWAKHRALFPNVARAARKWLSVQATSAPAERVFSLMKRVFEARRNLDPVQIAHQVFQRMNSHFLRKRDRS